MKSSWASLVLIILVGCSGQSTKREIYNEDFKWRITIPENFENVEPDDWKKLQSKGETAIENTYGEEIVNQSKVIFVFKSGELNYFESNSQPFDEKTDGDYMESWKMVNEVLYQTFVSQMPGTKIDSASSIERIDQLDFHTITMKIAYPNKMIMNFIMYSRLFDNREFTVNIMYVDESKGQLMKDSWFASKFAK